MNDADNTTGTDDTAKPDETTATETTSGDNTTVTAADTAAVTPLSPDANPADLTMAEQSSTMTQAAPGEGKTMDPLKPFENQPTPDTTTTPPGAAPHEMAAQFRAAADAIDGNAKAPSDATVAPGQPLASDPNKVKGLTRLDQARALPVLSDDDAADATEFQADEPAHIEAFKDAEGRTLRIVHWLEGLAAKVIHHGHGQVASADEASESSK